MIKRTRWLQIGLGVLIIGWSIIPIYWGLVVSLTTATGIISVPPPLVPHPFTLQYFSSLLNDRSVTSQTFLRGFTNSFVEAGLVTVLTLILATLAGYGFARYRFRGSNPIFVLIIATLSLPIYAIMIPLFQMMTHLHLMDTYTVVVIINAAGSLPLALWLVRSHIASLPLEIEEAARIDGASGLRMLGRIVVPLIAPGIASVTVIVFLFGWGSFLIPLTFTSSLHAIPVTVIITQYVTKYSENYGLQAAAGMVALVPPLIIVAWFNRYLLRGLLRGSLTS